MSVSWIRNWVDFLNLSHTLCEREPVCCRASMESLQNPRIRPNRLPFVYLIPPTPPDRPSSAASMSLTLLCMWPYPTSPRRSDLLDPFIVTENSQRLGDRLVDAAGTNFNRMFNFLLIETGNCAGLQSRGRRSNICVFSSLIETSKTPGFWRPLSIFPNTIKYIIMLETAE